MIGSNLIDSSVWIQYLFDAGCKELIETEEQNYISVLSLFEIKLKLLKKNVKKSEVKEKMDFIKKKNIVLELNEKISENAAELATEKNLPAIDSIIYSTSIENNLILITLDNDFRGLNNVKFF